MTDRVIVPRGVPKLYAGIYEQVEDEQHPESIVLEFERCIRSEILKNGGEAKKFINTIIPELEYWNSSLFRCDPDFKYEIFQKICEEDSKTSGDRLHIECAAKACQYVYNMIGERDGIDIPDEINIQYHLNICDARSDQIQNELPETKAEQFILIRNIRISYEKRLRNPENHAKLKGNEYLLDIDMARGTSDL